MTIIYTLQTTDDNPPRSTGRGGGGGRWRRARPQHARYRDFGFTLLRCLQWCAMRPSPMFAGRCPCPQLGPAAVHVRGGHRASARGFVCVQAPHLRQSSQLRYGWSLLGIVKARGVRSVTRSGGVVLGGEPASKYGRLSAAGRAAAATGAYISLAGLCVLVAPQRCLSLLFSAASVAALGSGWARVFAVLAATFGSYYSISAFAEWRGEAAPVAFYRATVTGRLLLAAAFSVLVATRCLPEPGLALLGGINAVGALAMHVALRADAARMASRSGTSVG